MVRRKQLTGIELSRHLTTKAKSKVKREIERLKHHTFLRWLYEAYLKIMVKHPEFDEMDVVNHYNHIVWTSGSPRCCAMIWEQADIDHLLALRYLL